MINSNFPRNLISITRQCYTEFEQHLTTTRVTYTQDIAQQWTRSLCDTVPQEIIISYKCAMIRLHRLLSPDWKPIALVLTCAQNYDSLSVGFRNILDSYLCTYEDTITKKAMWTIKDKCSRFLSFLQQDLGLTSVDQIQTDAIALYYEIYLSNKKHPGNAEGTMLTFFYEHHNLQYGNQFLLHYLTLNKGFYWNNIGDVTFKEIDALIDRGGLSLSFLEEFKIALRKYFDTNQYSARRYKKVKFFVELLTLFFATNNLAYNPLIADMWCKRMKESIYEYQDLHRVVKQIEEYSKDQKFHVLPRLMPPNSFYYLPLWCQETCNTYLDIKKREGLAITSLNMIRSSIYRFCTYIDEIGVHSFSELTADHVLSFNANDIHVSKAGKNAYNSRIRNFLFYLGDKGYLVNPFLFNILGTNYSTEERNVIVLTDEELNALQEQFDSEESRLSLRMKSMLLLGLKMGMRGCDIVNLKFTDINWETETISFIQQKIGQQVTLPMPIEVGNSLYRYITEERPKNETLSIFLTERAPYEKVGVFACRTALNAALPDRNVPKSGFHVLRKSFATELLRKDTGIDMVSNALGHRGTVSVQRYLSLDEKRIRMCTLTYNDFGIEGWDPNDPNEL